MALLAIAALLFSCLPLRAQYGQGGKVKGFKIPEFYPISEKVPPNRMKMLVTGAEAEPYSAELVALKEMNLETYTVDGRTNIVAKAPQCLVRLENRAIADISSTNRIEMVTGDGRFYIEGNEGFYCRMTNNISLVVSNHGRTIIRHGLLALPTK
jgi:hypothetical protein